MVQLLINANKVYSYEKATEWMKDQAVASGWHTAKKLFDRKTTQGRIAVSCDKQSACLIEVNCETDFVGKNEEFIGLVERAVKACLVDKQSDTITEVRLHLIS